MLMATDIHGGEGHSSQLEARRGSDPCGCRGCVGSVCPEQGWHEPCLVEVARCRGRGRNSDKGGGCPVVARSRRCTSCLGPELTQLDCRGQKECLCRCDCLALSVPNSDRKSTRLNSSH